MATQSWWKVPPLWHLKIGNVLIQVYNQHVIYTIVWVKWKVLWVLVSICSRNWPSHGNYALIHCQVEIPSVEWLESSWDPVVYCLNSNCVWRRILPQVGIVTWKHSVSSCSFSLLIGRSGNVCHVPQFISHRWPYHPQFWRLLRCCGIFHLVSFERHQRQQLFSLEVMSIEIFNVYWYAG